jgi:hypothetical protein
MDLILNSSAVRRWVAEILTVFFLIGGLVGIAVGVGLIVRSEQTLRFFGSLNRWISLRRAARPLEIPRDTTAAVQKSRRWLAAAFIVGGAFTTYILATKFEANAAIKMFNLAALRPSIGLWIVESGRWILIVGNLLAVVAGILLAFFPPVVAALETRGSRWFSERRILKGTDNQNLTLDRWVAAYPRPAGAIITAGALILIGNFGIMLLGMR